MSRALKKFLSGRVLFALLLTLPLSSCDKVKTLLKLPTGAEKQPTEAGEGQPTEAGEGQPTEAGEGQPTEAGEGQPTEAGEGQPTGAGEGQPAAAEGQEAKISYATGYLLGEHIKQQGAALQKDLFLQGLNHSLQEKTPSFPIDEIESFGDHIEKTFFSEKSEAKKEGEADGESADGESTEGESTEEKKTSETDKTGSLDGGQFLEKNKAKKGVKTTNSGLQYEILKAGTGKSPAAVDTVEVHYRGTLLNGTEFDSSYKRQSSAKFPLNKVIKGWTEGLQLMKEGAKYKFYIPSELGYGPRGAGPNIPPNAMLIFEVELLKVNPSAAGAPPPQNNQPQ